MILNLLKEAKLASSKTVDLFLPSFVLREIDRQVEGLQVNEIDKKDIGQSSQLVRIQTNVMFVRLQSQMILMILIYLKKFMMIIKMNSQVLLEKRRFLK